MKIVVVGCTHAGTEATKDLARMYPDATECIDSAGIQAGVINVVNGLVRQYFFMRSQQQVAFTL